MSIADRYDAFLLDLDGVVWRGDSAVPGAAEALEALRERGKRVVFVTNNASRSARDYAAKLMKLRIATEPSDIVTSAHAVVDHLHEIGLERGARIHVFGTTALAQVLRSAGFETTTESSAIDALVVAWNPRLTFDDLGRAADVARSGVPFIGANRDATYPAEEGLLPGTGAILAAIEVASGRQATVVGKPAPYLFRSALERAGRSVERTLFIGDRIESDVVGALAAGVPVALVLTGVSRRDDLASLDGRPDWILDDLDGLFADASSPDGQRPSGGQSSA